MSKETKLPTKSSREELIAALKKNGATHILTVFEEEEKWKQELKKIPRYDFIEEYEKRKKKLHLHIDQGCDTLGDMVEEASAGLIVALDYYGKGITENNEELISTAIETIDPITVRSDIEHVYVESKYYLKNHPKKEDLLSKALKVLNINVGYIEDIQRLMKAHTDLNIVEHAFSTVLPLMQAQEYRFVTDCQCIIDEAEKKE